MDRRQFIGKTALFSTTLGVLSAGAGSLFAASSHDKTKAAPAGSPLKKLSPPGNGPITVAILISEGVNVIDFSGPWGVFESVSLPNASEMPFRLLAVADTADVVSSASGLR